MLSILEPQRIRANAGMLGAVVAGPGESYFAALNLLQGGYPIPIDKEHPLLVFDLDDAAQAHVTRTLVEAGLAQEEAAPLPPRQRGEADGAYAEGIGLLGSYHPDLPSCVGLLIGRIVFVHVNNCASASSNDPLGTVWISPRPEWTPQHYAETVCHELTHQALFLEDMLDPLFADRDDEPMVVSSIRRVERPYESSFHAAVVAAALIELGASLGSAPITADPGDGLVESVAAFRAAADYLTPRGRELLSELDVVAGRAAVVSGGGMR